MNSRKHPNDLSQKQLNRRLAFAMKSFHEAVEVHLLELRKCQGMSKTDEKKADATTSSVVNEPENILTSSNQGSRLNFDSLMNYLSSSGLDEESNKIMQEFELLVPEEQPINPLEEINNILNPEITSQDPSIDFFHIMMNLQCNDEEILESDEDDSGFFDELFSLKQNDPKYVFMNGIRMLCIDYIHTVPHTFVKKLLEKLIEGTGYPFPRDPRTFLKTPRKSVVVDMGEGQYCHYGIESALSTFLTSYKHNGIEVDNIALIANIDGAQFANSSADGTWIISISETRLKLAEVVGIYKGKHKPKDSNQLLHMFVDELTNLINNGIVFENKTYAVTFQCLVCDSPAKSYVMKTKQHNGYYSCSKCTIKGVHENNRLFFPKDHQENAVLRTDEKFLRQAYQKDPDEDDYDEYQIGESIMKNIPNFRPITDVVLDYMHLILLGVMVKLIEIWIKDHKCILSEYQRQSISERLASFKEYMPSDFSRNPRDFENVKRLWKAHELRAFLLYTGPLALYKILPQHLYLHFLSLHVAISILVNPILCRDEEYLAYAEKLLVLFVNSFEEYYGQSNVVHNIHNIRHLVNDVRQFGCLDNFSAFRFENHIRKVKQLIRKGDKVLEQIANRLMEIKAANEFRDGDDGLIQGENSSEVLQQGTLKIDCRNRKDRYVLLDNGRYLECNSFIKEKDGAIYVEGHLFKTLQTFYEVPLKSDTLNINVIGHAYSEKPTKIFPFQSIVAKICALPFNEKFLAVPLIHTYNQIGSI